MTIITMKRRLRFGAFAVSALCLSSLLHAAGTLAPAEVQAWTHSIGGLFGATAPDLAALQPTLSSLKGIDLEDPGARAALAPVYATVQSQVQAIQTDAAAARAVRDDEALATKLVALDVLSDFQLPATRVRVQDLSRAYHDALSSAEKARVRAALVALDMQAIARALEPLRADDAAIGGSYDPGLQKTIPNAWKLQKPAKAAGAADREAHIGVRLLEAAGVNVTPEIASRVERVETAVARFNSLYAKGYHGGIHQFGADSVADLVMRMVTSNPPPKPAGLSRKAFAAVRDELLVDLYLAGLVHDVESVPVEVGEDGSVPKHVYIDGTKSPILVSSLGEPVEVVPLEGGRALRLYAKPRDSRSFLPTTLETLDKARSLADANTPSLVYMALNGTAFSPEEKAVLMRDGKETATAIALKKAILKKHGPEGLKLADEFSRKLGVADVLNHYVRRDRLERLQAMEGLEIEFADPMVKVKGSFGFMEFVLAKDSAFVANYPSLPADARRQFVSQLIDSRRIQADPGLLAGGVEAAARRLENNPVDSHPEWADKPFVELVEAVKSAFPLPPK